MKTLKEMLLEYEPKVLEVCTDYNTYECLDIEFTKFNEVFLGHEVKWYSCCGQKLIVVI